jgi:hypothetical protein
MRVGYVPEARTELTEAAVFYEDRRPGLGERFLAVIRGTEKLVGAFRIPGRSSALSASITPCVESACTGFRTRSSMLTEGSRIGVSG